MTVHNIHSKDYAHSYLVSHKNAKDELYRKKYWNHFFIDRMVNPSSSADTHFLEEGGGTCGVWELLSYDYYSSVDLSVEMTSAARTMYASEQNKTFIVGDIFSSQLNDAEYSAIIANAYGIYYRPDYRHLKRFSDLLKKDGVLFVAIDPLQHIKHFLVAPFAGLINKKIRTYTRISISAFENMARAAGFRVWMAVDYEPSSGWYRRAYFLVKD
jgi:trans-aconitate methyltransferase